MAEKKFSELTAAATLGNDDIFALSQIDSGSLASKKTTLTAIANHINTVVQYTNAYGTQAKTTAGAINELKQLISLIPQFSIEVVEELPTEDISDTTIYLVPAEDPEVGNYYEEYIHVNNTWELVGTTAVDLSAYYTKLEVDGLLATKANVTEVALKENKSDMPTDVRTIIKDCKTPKNATITNGIAQFECIEENLVKGLKITMSPIQSGSGNPSPTNIRPISGRTEASVNQGSVDITTLYNGQIQSTGDFSRNNNRISNANSSQMNTYFLKKGTHTLTFNKLNQSAPDLVECTVLTKNDNFEIVDNFATAWHSLPYTFELTADAYVYFTARKDYGTALNTADYKTLIIDETHTHQYSDTIYGGSDDFVNGGATVTKGYVDLSTLTWELVSLDRWQSEQIADITNPSGTSTATDAICDTYNGVAITTLNADETLLAFSVFGNRIYLRNGDTTNTPTGNVCYTLATPTTISTSAEEITTVAGTNVISGTEPISECKYTELATVDDLRKIIGGQ